MWGTRPQLLQTPRIETHHWGLESHGGGVGAVQAVGQVRLPLLPEGSCAREESRARPLRKLLPPRQWFVLSVTRKGLPS